MRCIPLLIGFALAFRASGQDAATEERLNKLSGQIEDLIAGQTALTKRIEGLAKDISELRDEIAKPNPAYATQEDLNHLANALREMDQKRLDDYDKIRIELLELSRALTNPVPAPETSSTNAPVSGTNSLSGTLLENGVYEYVIQPNDALSIIAQTFRRERNLKVTVNDILKANPGLSPARIPARPEDLDPRAVTSNPDSLAFQKKELKAVRFVNSP